MHQSRVWLALFAWVMMSAAQVNVSIPTGTKWISLCTAQGVISVPAPQLADSNDQHETHCDCTFLDATPVDASQFLSLQLAANNSTPLHSVHIKTEHRAYLVRAPPVVFL